MSQGDFGGIRAKGHGSLGNLAQYVISFWSEVSSQKEEPNKRQGDRL